jgi:hypothetical protein
MSNVCVFNLRDGRRSSHNKVVKSFMGAQLARLQCTKLANLHEDIWYRSPGLHIIEVSARSVTCSKENFIYSRWVTGECVFCLVPKPRGGTLRECRIDSIAYS